MSTALDRLRVALADRYRIVRELGRGGMATVYLAEDLKHHRQIAIKVINPDVSADFGREQFLREIEIVANLNHPHILPLHDSGVANDQLFFVMPFISGESLRARMAREGQLPVDDSLRIAREIASALGYAHDLGIVHRDIKPENVLLSGGMALVADFGIARTPANSGSDQATKAVTRVGVTLGTPRYMSPEQACGGPVDGRSDVYSLACVLYEMLAGQSPFVATTAERMIQQHLTVEAHPVTELRPAVSRDLASAVAKGLAKLPADRFASAAKFMEALHQREPAAAGRQDHGRRSIAVLPFQNLTPEGSQNYFAGGLHDELLTQLAKVGALRVISRTSVMGYLGTSKRLKQIADELGVGSVVEGSVQVLGERLRVNVQLIDAMTDEHLWAERYDRTLDDAFEIQSEVARHVVSSVGALLNSAEQRRITAPPTVNAEAYRLYLQGRAHWTRPGNSRTDSQCAQEFFERALEVDPGFALAHAALSQAHGRMFWFGYDARRERAERQLDAATAALGLSPDLVEARIAMAVARYCGQRDYHGALQEFNRALEACPTDGDLWFWIAAAHRRLGNWKEGISAFGRASQLDPRNAELFLQYGKTLQVLRDYSGAVGAFERALALAPDLDEAAWEMGWTYAIGEGQLDTLQAVLSRNLVGADPSEVAAERAAFYLWTHNAYGLLRLLESSNIEVFVSQRAYLPITLYAAWAYEMRGDQDAARTSFESARVRLDAALEDLPGDWRLHAARGLALAGLGCRDEALRDAECLRQSIKDFRDAFDGPDLEEDRARILARSGDGDGALDAIERLLAGPSRTSVHTLRLDPRWDPIRQLPRFQSLLTGDGKDRSP